MCEDASLKESSAVSKVVSVTDVFIHAALDQ